MGRRHIDGCVKEQWMTETLKRECVHTQAGLMAGQRAMAAQNCKMILNPRFVFFYIIINQLGIISECIYSKNVRNSHDMDGRIEG